MSGFTYQKENILYQHDNNFSEHLETSNLQVHLKSLQLDNFLKIFKLTLKLKHLIIEN